MDSSYLGGMLTRTAMEQRRTADSTAFAGDETWWQATGEHEMFLRVRGGWFRVFTWDTLTLFIRGYAQPGWFDRPARPGTCRGRAARPLSRTRFAGRRGSGRQFHGRAARRPGAASAALSQPCRRRLHLLPRRPRRFAVRRQPRGPGRCCWRRAAGRTERRCRSFSCTASCPAARPCLRASIACCRANN